MKFYEKLLCLVLKLAFLYPLIEKRTIKVRRFFDEEKQMNLSLTHRRNYFKVIAMVASQLLTMQLDYATIDYGCIATTSKVRPNLLLRHSIFWHQRAH
jgi:hypothetical protein